MKTLYQRRDKIRDSIPRLARDVDFAEAELEDFRAEVESQEFARSARPLDASY